MSINNGLLVSGSDKNAELHNIERENKVRTLSQISRGKLLLNAIDALRQQSLCVPN